MTMFINRKNYMFRPIERPSSGFDNFFVKRVLYNMPKPRDIVEISSSFYPATYKLIDPIDIPPT